VASRRQLRVGTQWLYAGDAEKLLKEAIRIREEEELQHQLHGHHIPWIRKYVFSTDHKWIGIQYAVTALCFLLFGFSLMLLMRLQLGWPGHPFELMKVLGETRAPGGILLPEAYNQLGAMHGTIMVFLAIVPLAVGAFGNYVVPLQIGAPDMAFPKLNMASYWCYLSGGLVMLAKGRSVRAGLLVGALVGVAAFFGALMNMSFLLAGSASTNPVLFTMAIGLMLAWKVAGYYGLDRYLLPMLGTPWRAKVQTGRPGAAIPVTA